MFTIFTHNGAFHADDVLAVAMLRFAGFEFELIRTRTPSVLEAAINDPNTLIVDVGGVFNPSMLNFDHHQDMSLPSAAGMIYENFKDAICPVDAQPFFAQFISSIDAIDTNRNNIYAVWNTLPEGFRNTSSIIAGFNRDVMNAAQQDEQFNKAVEFALTIIENERHSAIEKAKSERQYSERSILPNNVAVFNEFSTVWKEKGEHQFAVLPHPSGWQIQSRDTAVATVPEMVAECEGFIFRHGSGFMAVFSSREAAVTCAALITHTKS